MNRLFRGLPLIALSTSFLLHSGILFEQTVSRALQVSHDYKRPLMLLFVASDCPACASIQSYLEGDEIKEAVAKRYVAAKVDINDFDGQACSEIYGIGKVPALVIVDARGTIMYKAQGQISLDELASMIEETSASLAEESEKEQTTPEAVPMTDAAEAPDMAHVNERPEKASPPVPKEVSVQSEATRTPVATTPDPPKIEIAPPTQRVGEITHTGKSYSIQLGFFSNREYAIRMQERAAQSGLQGVEIIPLQRDGKDFFRVLFGNYPTAQAADVSSTPLRESGFDVKVHRNRL
ncbi:MAG: SPOR domain-containing protein [Saprospiraceae bacterium]|nr:SPOR domain-containing protein [Saprospiraceae bacterium]